MLIATFRLELEGFALQQAFREVPDMTVEAERIAAHSMEWTMPCVWIAADDFDEVDSALESDPSVTEIVDADAFGDEKYYHLDWADEIDQWITRFIDQEGSILQAEAGAAGWRIRMRFVSRDQFDTFRAMLQDEGHSYELVELFEPGAPRQAAAAITPSQRDALVVAAEHGYFAVPREISTRELATELGMAHQSLSELLRRGTGNLITSSLMTDVGRDGS